MGVRQKGQGYTLEITKNPREPSSEEATITLYY